VEVTLHQPGELQQFYEFLGRRIRAGEVALSPEEALDQWRWELEPPADRYEENVAAIREAIDGMNAGDQGKPADEVLRKIREELGFAADR
jgi:hypothetical protein